LKTKITSSLFVPLGNFFDFTIPDDVGNESGWDGNPTLQSKGSKKSCVRDVSLMESIPSWSFLFVGIRLLLHHMSNIFSIVIGSHCKDSTLDDSS